jgi:hypothetical protein
LRRGRWWYLVQCKPWERERNRCNCIEKGKTGDIAVYITRLWTRTREKTPSKFQTYTLHVNLYRCRVLNEWYMPMWHFYIRFWHGPCWAETSAYLRRGFTFRTAVAIHANPAFPIYLSLFRERVCKWQTIGTPPFDSM